MWIFGCLIGLTLIVLTLLEGFETILQPRRVTRRFRYARLYYRSAWAIWGAVAALFSANKRREAFLSIFGPLSLLGLFATWVFGLIVGFALINWSIGSAVHASESTINFKTYLYLSGTTFFTLGYGDVTPTGTMGRFLAVIESGLGFGFLAMIIGYLPVLYQAYSRRELTIALMDARAGISAQRFPVLLRLARSGRVDRVERFLIEWEEWSAELLENHLSFPVLSYYRSQHDNQSWLAALATILDTCALLLTEVRGADKFQAQLTFAMARHAAVDLSLVFKVRPKLYEHDRLSGQQLGQMKTMLKESGLSLHEDAEIDARLAELRGMYEPFINALAKRFQFSIPSIATEAVSVDNWQRSSWMARPPGIGDLPATQDDHFR